MQCEKMPEKSGDGAKDGVNKEITVTSTTWPMTMEIRGSLRDFTCIR